MNSSENQEKPEEKEYIKSVVTRMVKDIALERPKDKEIPQFMMKWLLKNGEITGNLLNYAEKDELQKIRVKISEYRKYDSHSNIEKAENPNPNPAQNAEEKDMSDNDEEDIDKELTKENIKAISA